MNWAVDKRAGLGLLLVLVAFVVSAVLAYRNIQAVAQKEELVVHTHEVLDTLNAVLRQVINAETGQRGFIITNDPAYLEPYHDAVAGLEPLRERLRKLVKDSPEQTERLQRVEQSVASRMERLALGIDVQRRGGFGAGQMFVQSGAGRDQMLEIRREMRDMIDREEQLLEQRTLNSRAIYRTAIFTTLLSTACGVGLVGVVYFMAARELGARARIAAELERRVDERTQELAEANQALQTSNRELEQFASVASHDLQEPLRKIEAFGDRLRTRSQTLDEQSREYLDRILTSASRMRVLINDLLTFSRVTTRAQPPRPVDLGKVAEEVVSDLEARLQQTGGEIKLGSLPRIEADPLQMRQLLQNLIGNGLKFHRPDVPPVVVVEGSVSQNGAGPVCILTVQDNGIGFEEIYLDRIFNLFQRLHGRNEYEGTGMGLAICRKIVEHHGGTITAESAPDQGARFIVTLPLEQSS